MSQLQRRAGGLSHTNYRSPVSVGEMISTLETVCNSAAVDGLRRGCGRGRRAGRRRAFGGAWQQRDKNDGGGGSSSSATRRRTFSKRTECVKRGVDALGLKFVIIDSSHRLCDGSRWLKEVHHSDVKPLIRRSQPSQFFSSTSVLF